MNKVIDAALALIERWDTPLWKDAVHTAELIQALRESIREYDLVCLSETHQQLDEALTERMTFNHWWNEGEVSPGDNPYTHETAAYWAWEGWQAGAKAEREACAQLVDHILCEGGGTYGDAIRARGRYELHKAL